MSANPFQKASRSQVFLKDAITGPTGSGKTFSALRMAFGLVEGTGKRVALLDTENESASLYSDQFDFDVMPIAPPYGAEAFRSGVMAAVDAGYGCVIIDSASHLWKGTLEYKSQIDARGGNQWTNWKEPDKKFQEAIDAVLQSKIHVLFCMRSKMEYILEDNGKGKQAPRKVGLAPVMKDGLEYEFSTVFDIGLDHSAQASKDRTGLFPNDKIFQITEETGKQIANWLRTAKPKVEETSKPEPTPEERKAKAMALFAKFFSEHSERLNITIGDYEKSFTVVATNGAPGKLDDHELDELISIWQNREVIAARVVVSLTTKSLQR